MEIISILNHKSVSHSINQHKPHHNNHTKNFLRIHYTTRKSIHQDNNVTIPESQWQIWAHRMQICNMLQSSRAWHQLNHKSSWLHPLYVPCPHSSHVCMLPDSLQPTYTSETRVSELLRLFLSWSHTYRNFYASMRSSRHSLSLKIDLQYMLKRSTKDIYFTRYPCLLFILSKQLP